VLGTAPYLGFRQVTERLGDLALALVAAVQVDQRGPRSQGGACGAAGRRQRSASALEGPAERAPAQTLLAPQITKG